MQRADGPDPAGLCRTEIGEHVTLSDLLTGDIVLDPAGAVTYRVWRSGNRLIFTAIPSNAPTPPTLADARPARRLARGDASVALATLAQSGLAPIIIGEITY